MNHSEAKFKREQKDTPQDWVIAPCRSGVTLIYIGKGECHASSRKD